MKRGQTASSRGPKRSDPDTGLFTDWEGHQSTSKYRYSYKAGKPPSGYVVDRVGKFGNCPWFGCVEHWQPRDILRAHSDGTYSWRMVK